MQVKFAFLNRVLFQPFEAVCYEQHILDFSVGETIGCNFRQFLVNSSFSLCRIRDAVQKRCAVWHVQFFEQFNRFLFLRKNALPFIFCFVDEKTAGSDRQEEQMLKNHS